MTEQDVERVARAIYYECPQTYIREDETGERVQEIEFDALNGDDMDLLLMQAKAALAAMPRTFEATCLCGHTLMMTEGTNKHEKALAVAREALVKAENDGVSAIQYCNSSTDTNVIEILKGRTRRIQKALATIDELAGK